MAGYYASFSICSNTNLRNVMIMVIKEKMENDNFVKKTLITPYGTIIVLAVVLMPLVSPIIVVE